MIEVRVCGIPALADVTLYNVVKGSFRWDEVSDLDYRGYTELEFDLYDRRGYRAKWLEAKMHRCDGYEDVAGQIERALN